MTWLTRTVRNGLLALSGVACARVARAQRTSPEALRTAVRAYANAHDADIVRELRTFVAIPNLASDAPNIQRNADHLIGMLGARGIAARRLESPSGGPPAVYGELMSPGAARTIVFYAHYDGQPVDTTRWTTPPWQPVLRDNTLEAGGRIVPIPASPGLIQGEWRLYGRSASDDKAPIVAMLTAIDALKAAGVVPSVNLKFFFEGEKESGSGHLHELLERNAGLLKADAWLFGDGPVHQSRRQQIVFGARGVTGVNLTVYGATRGLHSGHYGNWAPNPVTMIANLVASMRNDDGRILIKHFYDDVVPARARANRESRVGVGVCGVAGGAGCAVVAGDAEGGPKCARDADRRAADARREPAAQHVRVGAACAADRAANRQSRQQPAFG